MDYGCGPGTFFSKYMGEIAKDKQLKLIGVDISKEMVEYAKENSHILGITEYVVGNILDGKSWPFQGGTFDRVIASNVIHSVEDYKLVEPSLIRDSNIYDFQKCEYVGHTSVLVNQIRVVEVNTGGSWIWRDPREEIPQFENALLSAGFKIKEYHHSSVGREYRDIRECLGFLIIANGPLSTIPVGSELYERLMEDLIQNARTFLGNEVEAKPFNCYSDTYSFIGEKVKVN